VKIIFRNISLLSSSSFLNTKQTSISLDHLVHLFGSRRFHGQQKILDYLVCPFSSENYQTTFGAISRANQYLPSDVVSNKSLAISYNNCYNNFNSAGISIADSSKNYFEEKENEEVPAVTDGFDKEETESFGSDLIDEIGCDPSDYKLPASKSPIMEAMVVCAIKNWGIAIHANSPNQVVFRVTDFEKYYKISRAICSKQHPTEDIGSRVKSLRRWFDNFPKKKDRQDNPNFLLDVKSSGTKKVNEMIERNTRLMGVQKRRRRQ